jgi:hypothetical protein
VRPPSSRSTTAATAGRDRTTTAVDVGDATVVEAGQMVDGLRDPFGVGPDDIDAVEGHGAADDHDRKLPVEAGQARGGRLRA